MGDRIVFRRLGWPAALVVRLGMLIICAVGMGPDAAQAGTLVRFDFGTFGQVYVNLFDDLTPQSVNNFLNRYVDADNNPATAGRYDNTMIHRVTTMADSGIGVVQGGGFDLQASGIYSSADPHVPLEYSRANSMGTLAMARQSAPDTGQSQWFFNYTDNSTALAPRVDNPATPQNEHSDGYAVFGWIVGDGLNVIKNIGAVPTFAYAAPFGQVPLTNFTAQDKANDVDPLPHVVKLLSVSVVGKNLPAFQNPLESLRADINNDGKVSPQDLQLIVTALQANGQHDLIGPFAGTNYLDPSGDGRVSPSDIQRVVTALQTASPLVSPLVADALLADPMAFHATPEPSTLALGLLAAAAGAGLAVRRRFGLVPTR